MKIYNEDCMVGMKRFKDNHFDLAIVDPPYGLGLNMVLKVDSNKRQKRRNRTVVNHQYKNWNETVPNAQYFNELKRVSKNRIIWGCNYYAQHIYQDKGRIIHDKMMGTENTKFNWSHADIASASMFKRIVMFRYQWAGNKQNGTINWDNSGPDARIHPTQKPIALYKWLLTNYAKEGDKILDTHMGSGSIAIACHYLDFDLTAFEIDKEYYESAMKRIKEQTSQLEMQF